MRTEPATRPAASPYLTSIFPLSLRGSKSCGLSPRGRDLSIRIVIEWPAVLLSEICPNVLPVAVQVSKGVDDLLKHFLKDAQEKTQRMPLRQSRIRNTTGAELKQTGTRLVQDYDVNFQ